ncbi:hypothetical protein EcWSU1_04075 [Enterobacter ludwigii]|uniref:Uncharacterized protein n=1 Tax=Enterobacter ludwigii TaxID=299767 RepID=G8LHB2_9ENTR|nr:hypothetical protein EcWSU1_04075 [Enterobacter ludwigii]
MQRFQISKKIAPSLPSLFISSCGQSHIFNAQR